MLIELEQITTKTFAWILIYDTCTITTNFEGKNTFDLSVPCEWAHYKLHKNAWIVRIRSSKPKLWQIKLEQITTEPFAWMLIYDTITTNFEGKWPTHTHRLCPSYNSHWGNGQHKHTGFVPRTTVTGAMANTHTQALSLVQQSLGLWPTHTHRLCPSYYSHWGNGQHTHTGFVPRTTVTGAMANTHTQALSLDRTTRNGLFESQTQSWHMWVWPEH